MLGWLTMYEASSPLLSLSTKSNTFPRQKPQSKIGLAEMGLICYSVREAISFVSFLGDVNAAFHIPGEYRKYK